MFIDIAKFLTNNAALNWTFLSAINLIILKKI